MHLHRHMVHMGTPVQVPTKARGIRFPQSWNYRWLLAVDVGDLRCPTEATHVLNCQALSPGRSLRGKVGCDGENLKRDVKRIPQLG